LRAGKTELSLFGKKYQVRASVTVIDGFSAHGDQQEMLQVIKHHATTAQHVFLVHGDYEVQQKYADFLMSNNFKNIEIPTLGQEFQI
jgi:metallo-beta-lactamase family protein